MTTDERLLVAEIEGRVGGFLLAYPLTRADDEVIEAVRGSVTGPCFVVKQISVDPTLRRRGVGRALYDEVLTNLAPAALVAAVVTEPPNLASARFHRELDFRVLTSFTGADGRERDLGCSTTSRHVQMRTPRS